MNEVREDVGTDRHQGWPGSEEGSESESVVMIPEAAGTLVTSMGLAVEG
jgi:hypothetical protein